MNIYEDEEALPFQTYHIFLEKIKESRPKLHKYLKDFGFVIDDEKTYERFISEANFPQDDSSREDWERVAKKFRYTHLNKIDTFCSELVSLSDSVVQDEKVLFCGCGNGDLIEWMKRNTTADVIGLDYARGMLMEYGNVVKSPAVILAECGNIPVQGESIKQVILSSVETKGLKALISECDRVLIPGGEVRLNKVFQAAKYFQQYRENFLDALRKSNYDAFMKNYIEQRYGTQKSKDELNSIMENVDCTEPVIQHFMTILESKGFDASYEFSKFPLIPRACHLQVQGFQLPYTVVGRKKKD